jgi:hypothetical protein
MDSGQIFFVRRGGKVHGPFAREQLRALALDGHIDAATEIAAAAEGPWARLETLPALRRVLAGDAPAAFERANHDGQPPIDLRDVIAAANVRPAPFAPGSPAPASRPVSAPHDVPSLLQFNLAIENKRGLHKLKPLLFRRSRRRRDYLVLMAFIGVVIFSTLVIESFVAVQVQVLAARMPDQFWPIFNAVLFHSPILAWGLAAFATFAIALGWLMFGLMDDY